MIRLPGLLLSLLFCLSSCSFYHLDFEQKSSQIYPAKKSASEVLYRPSVDQPFETIGTIKVNAERSQRITEIVEQMKWEAALLGGDAITNIRIQKRGEKAARLTTLLGYVSLRANYIADVVVFKK